MKGTLVFCSLLTGCVVIFAFIWDSIEEEVSNSGPQRTRSHGPPYPGDKLENIFWFMQITDFHISRFWDLNRAADLTRFLKEHVSSIGPDLIIASGDLTDAKMADQQGSRQFEDEWQTYRRALVSSGILSSTVWLDIRGNHDAFDVENLNSKTNFFRTYSVMGTEYSQSYAYELQKTYGTYYFNGVDACPNPGPKRPFNFFGYMPEDKVNDLGRLEKVSQGGNLTFWFGHYPSSTIVTDTTGLRTILGSGVAYLCGHLHTLGNLVPNLYTRQFSGNLELELGDWKDNRIYRVLAVDHDMLSFTDESIDHWPVVLITNPKNAQFQVPKHEPLNRIANSTHIRVLVFSPWPIEIVTIEVDEILQQGVYHAGKGLYVVPWSPKHYLHGLHDVTVKAKDNQGNFKKASHLFSLDGTHPRFKFVQSFILMSNVATVGLLLFIVSSLSVILPLFVMRKYKYPPKAPVSVSRSILRYPVNYMFTRLRWIWLISKCDLVYYALNAFTIYVAIGPWFLGYLLYDQLGLVFSWGIFIQSSFIPGSITYFYGLIQVFTFNFPLMLQFGSALDYNQRHKNGTARFGCLCWRRDWFLVALLAFQSYMAYGGFYLAYGGVALLIGPVRTWSVVMAFLLHYYSIRVVEKASLNSAVLTYR